MAEIEVLTETEGKDRWTFEVRVAENGRSYDYEVTLSFSDYDLWSHGRVPPEKVVKAAFEFLISNEPTSSILSKFDCALIRRYFPQVDKELPGMV